MQVKPGQLRGNLEILLKFVSTVVPVYLIYVKSLSNVDLDSSLEKLDQ